MKFAFFFVLFVQFLFVKACLYNKIEGFKSEKSLIQEDITTIEECQKSCNENSKTGCQDGYDWNTDPERPPNKRCAFSISATTVKFPGFDHYECEKKPTGCVYIPWINYKGNNTVEQREFGSLEDCEKSCRKNEESTCKYGFDWKYSESLCTFLTSPDFFFFKDVDTYVCEQSECKTPNCISCKNPRICDKCGIGYEMNNARKCISSFIEVHPDACDTNCHQCTASNVCEICNQGYILKPDKSCKPQLCVFMPLEGFKAKESKLQEGIHLVDECENACKVYSETTCKYGYDWKAVSEKQYIHGDCFFSTTTSLIATPGYDHFDCELSECQVANCMFCDTPTTCSSCVKGLILGLDKKCITPPSNCHVPNCQRCSTLYVCESCNFDYYLDDKKQCILQGCVYRHIQGFRGLNTLFQSNITSREVCEQYCRESPETCKYGYDWNTDEIARYPDGKCSFSTSATFIEFPGYDHYVCQGWASRISLPVILGIAAGVVVIVLIACVLTWFLKRKRDRPQATDTLPLMDMRRRSYDETNDEEPSEMPRN